MSQVTTAESHLLLFRPFFPTRTACRRAQELQEIVEQIDAASTFAKIGGFGRLIALVAPARRPEKVRCACDRCVPHIIYFLCRGWVLLFTRSI